MSEGPDVSADVDDNVFGPKPQTGDPIFIPKDNRVENIVDLKLVARLKSAPPTGQPSSRKIEAGYCKLQGVQTGEDRPGLDE
jgi:hypothetical protein